MSNPMMHPVVLVALGAMAFFVVTLLSVSVHDLTVRK